jgi:hypothetical protein
MRELREYILEDFHAYFGERKCRVRALKFPFKILLYVFETIDLKLLEQFCDIEKKEEL